jgi:hypothetical protein
MVEEKKKQEKREQNLEKVRESVQNQHLGPRLVSKLAHPKHHIPTKEAAS